MKKFIKLIAPTLPLPLMACLLVSPATALAATTAPTAATVAGGTVHFTGSVVTTACALSVDSEEQTVNLGQVRAASLASTGAESAYVPFTIKLTDCSLTDTATTTTDAYSGVALTFVGTPAGTNTKALALNGDGAAGGAATNVGVEILQSGTAMTIDGSAAGSVHELTQGTNTLNFEAAFVATAAGATAGTADADVTFNLTYE